MNKEKINVKDTTETNPDDLPTHDETTPIAKELKKIHRKTQTLNIHQKNLKPRDFILLEAYFKNKFSISKTAKEVKLSYNAIDFFVRKPVIKKFLTEYSKKQLARFKKLNEQNAFLAVTALRDNLNKRYIEIKELVDKKGNKEYVIIRKPVPISAISLALQSSGFYTPKFITKEQKDDNKNFSDLDKQIDHDLKEIQLKETK